MAFFRAPEVAWLYSGVTKMKPSKESITPAKLLVWSWLYIPIEAGTGSSRTGRANSAVFTSPNSASVRGRTFSRPPAGAAGAVRAGGGVAAVLRERLHAHSPAECLK